MGKKPDRTYDPRRQQLHGRFSRGHICRARDHRHFGPQIGGPPIAANLEETLRRVRGEPSNDHTGVVGMHLERRLAVAPLPSIG